MNTAYLRQRAGELLDAAHLTRCPKQRASLVMQAAELLGFAQQEEQTDEYRKLQRQRVVAEF
ncbi:MAG: hypothetical protein SFV21_21730 [Rhodospirillaceae bacterium]|nr:hypothetical protein [Rhodospirillaceae bacterium]